MIFKTLKTGYQKLKNALSKTRSLLRGKLLALFGERFDPAKLDELEQLLYEADLGVATAQELTAVVREHLQLNPEASSEELITLLKEKISAKLLPRKEIVPTSPHVILIVGVNGNGKTTTIAKLAHHYQSQGKRVLIGAADTFRAAALEQLETWANTLNVDLVRGQPGADPAAIAFDTLTKGVTKQYDIILIDTAGRLHTKTDLMQELAKINRTCQKVLPESPHETLLVLDATVGQNGVDQARTFSEHTPLTGLILTKLDGSAKGGIAISIQNTLHIPIQFIGTGEGKEDLTPFNPEDYVSALFD
ncbi:MAG: signal recognition particle-docking protein FtsY [Chlamydiia bacterium]|nr:signal recognition particle-docking protein FtsY [Chlamydiia bacterium]